MLLTISYLSRVKVIDSVKKNMLCIISYLSNLSRAKVIASVKMEYVVHYFLSFKLIWSKSDCLCQNAICCVLFPVFQTCLE